MFIDSLAGIIPPQSLEVRQEKKEDKEEPKPIKGSGESNGAQLDMTEQALSKKQKGGDRPKTVSSSPGTYSVGGVLKREISKEKLDQSELLPIDLCI